MTAGTGFCAAMVKVKALEVPPPGVGLNTVMEATPWLAMSAALIDAVTCVPFTNCVVLSAPFHRTMDPAMKLVPVTVSVNAGPPGGELAGFKALSVGTGFPGGPTEKPTAFDEPPPGEGLKTTTVAVPCVAISAAKMDAVNCVLLTNFVLRSD